MYGKMESHEFTSLKGNFSDSYNDLDYNVVLFERVEQVAGCPISSPSGISMDLTWISYSVPVFHSLNYAFFLGMHSNLDLAFLYLNIQLIITDLKYVMHIIMPLKDMPE